MPAYLPAHEAAVIWSGVAEIALGLLLLWPRRQWLAAWGIIAMLIAFLPVHVHMLVNSHLYPETPVMFLCCVSRCRRSWSPGRTGTPEVAVRATSAT